MVTDRSYAIAELTAATGFDRRTIVYYIQSGLLPKVGRRGPHTRYPAECLTRLQFIRGVRRLQSEGQLLTATLAEIHRALAAADEAAVRDLLDRGLPIDEVKALFAKPQTVPATLQPPAVSAQHRTEPVVTAPAITGVRGPSGEQRSYGLADAGIRNRAGAGQTIRTPDVQHREEPHPDPASRQAPTQAMVEDSDLGQLLRDLELRPTMNAVRNAPGAPEQWTEIPITSRVYLSVRGLAVEDAPLAEAVARGLKRALRARITSG